jgi:hypothetical protein
MRKNMNRVKRCTKCILPDTYPGVQFDKNGLCNVCSSCNEKKERKATKSKNELDRIIRKVKGRTRNYDVIVGLSGGKDSTYVAYYLKKEYDLKILGMNYDIGYRSPYAYQNLETLCERMDISLITYRPNRALLQKLFIHFLREHGEFCSVCNNLGYLIGASLSWRERMSLGFSPLMVGGWSKKYEFQHGVSVTSMQYFFNNLGPDLLKELLENPFIEEGVVRRFMHLEDPRQAQIGTRQNKKLGEYAMQFIQLPDYIDWNLLEIPKILESEIGWVHPPDVHESHFDCVLFPIKEYLKFKKYGLTQETIKNSVLVREGIMSREEALERISLEQRTEPEIMENFLETLQISREDINWEGEWSTGNNLK